VTQTLPSSEIHTQQRLPAHISSRLYHHSCSTFHVVPRDIRLVDKRQVAGLGCTPLQTLSRPVRRASSKRWTCFNVADELAPSRIISALARARSSTAMQLCAFHPEPHELVGNLHSAVPVLSEAKLLQFTPCLCLGEHLRPLESITTQYVLKERH
jgi:hypothetical protein